jgi:hypothetical protein
MVNSQLASYWNKNRLFMSVILEDNMVTRLQAGRLVFVSRQGQGLFFCLTASRPALDPTQPHIQCVPEAKRPRREADNSPPSSTEINNAWSYTSTPPYVFMTMLSSAQEYSWLGASLSTGTLTYLMLIFSLNTGQAHNSILNVLSNLMLLRTSHNTV